MNRTPLRFPRTASSAFRDMEYGACLERPVPRSLLASPAFWIGGALCLVFWIVLWSLFA